MEYSWFATMKQRKQDRTLTTIKQRVLLHISLLAMSPLFKKKKKKVNTVSLQISNWPCFLISFCSRRQQMLNKARGENAKFPEIESVILVCNSLEETLQGLHLSLVSRCLCGGKFICIFRGKMLCVSSEIGTQHERREAIHVVQLQIGVEPSQLSLHISMAALLFRLYGARRKIMALGYPDTEFEEFVYIRQLEVVCFLACFSLSLIT